MTDIVQVLNVWPSMFGMRVLVALKEKGVPYEYHEEDLSNKSPLLLSSNPIHKKIPVLIHNGKPVCESLIIVQYIDEAWPLEGKCFLPKDPYQRAVALFWADYVEKKCYDAGARIVKSPKGELQEQAKKDFTDFLVTMDSALRDVAAGKPYFGGDSIGLVDIAFAPFISWFMAYEVLGEFKLPDEQQCPHLNAWIKMVVEYPSVKEALQPPEKVLGFARSVRQRVLGA